MGQEKGAQVKALIFGVSGQDGSYLAELLLSKGYEVHGLVRRSSSSRRERIDHLPALHLHEGDILDGDFVRGLVVGVLPDEIYNLAAQSHVGTSFNCPSYTMDVVCGGFLSLLLAVEFSHPRARIYQASTSEMFGASPAPQHESTPFNPSSPYAVAKAAAHDLVGIYRRKGLHVSAGIMFNHESPRRGENFVTRKVTLGVAAIKQGRQQSLHLGNLSARRDWGYAPEYVEAMWRMLQQETPNDYVLARGVDYSVQDWVNLAFAEVGLNWEEYVVHDQSCERPVDVPVLRGDASKARRVLGWDAPTDVPSLVKLMVRHDLETK